MNSTTIEVAAKACTGCSETKPLISFHVDNGNPDGRTHRCADCLNEQSRKFRADHPQRSTEIKAKYRNANRDLVNTRERERSRAAYAADPERFIAISRRAQLKADYGLSIEEYDAMVLAQNNQCAICGEEEIAQFRGKQKRLSVDHDHESGAVRQLLCVSCNGILGMARESRAILESAVEYLRKHGK